MTNNNGCVCQECEKLYKVDVMVPDSIWNCIKPVNKPDGSGLLCGACIMQKIESISDFDAWKLSKL